jgi:hypothetical protein
LVEPTRPQLTWSDDVRYDEGIVPEHRNVVICQWGQSGGIPVSYGLPMLPHEIHEGDLWLQDRYVSAALTNQEYRTRLDRQKDLIVKKENEIQQWKEIVQVGGPVSDQERWQRIEELENVWPHVDTKPAEQNRLCKQSIERIE